MRTPTSFERGLLAAATGVGLGVIAGCNKEPTDICVPVTHYIGEIVLGSTEQQYVINGATPTDLPQLTQGGAFTPTELLAERREDVPPVTDQALESDKGQPRLIAMLTVSHAVARRLPITSSTIPLVLNNDPKLALGSMRLSSSYTEQCAQ